MRPLLLFLLIGPIAALGVFTRGAVGGESVRTVLFINAGSEPIYVIRAGHRDASQWSDDLLGATEIIDVGTGERVRVPLSVTCFYDVRAEYRDGHSQERDGLDLCASRRIVLDH
jgi:hypothetical protein